MGPRKRPRVTSQPVPNLLLATDADYLFDEIDAAVREAGSRVDEIARDAEDAGQVTRRGAEATSRVGAVTSQTTASMQEVAASSGELAQLAEDLTRTTSRFILRGRGGDTRGDDNSLRAA